jgi:hypothetical protein
MFLYDIYVFTQYVTISIDKSQDSSVVQRWATCWMIGGSSPCRGWEIFSSPLHPDQLWGPPSLLSYGYQGALSLGVKQLGTKLATHLHLVLRSRMLGAIPPFPQYNFMAWCSVTKKSTGTMLLFISIDQELMHSLKFESFLMVYSEVKFKSNGVKAFPCFRPF